MNSNTRTPRRRTVLLFLALVLSACATEDGGGQGTNPSGNTTLDIVATTTILGDIVSNVVGDAASIETLLPVGSDPHDHEASSQQIARINEADLVVVNGLLLEEGMVDVLEAAEADGANIVELAPLLDPIPFGGGETCDPALGHLDEEEEHAEEEADEHAAGSCDPHFWNDPVRVAEAARLLADELAELDDAVDWTANAERYADDLEQAHLEIETMLAGIPRDRRKLITNHDALGYFADRYGFEVLATVIPGGATLADPSSAELAALVDLIEKEGITVIFGENVEPNALADAVAAEVGEEVRVVELYTDSLGEPGSEADTLIRMLRADARLVADALG